MTNISVKHYKAGKKYQGRQRLFHYLPGGSNDYLFFGDSTGICLLIDSSSDMSVSVRVTPSTV